jgi:hypothetical protein
LEKDLAIANELAKKTRKGQLISIIIKAKKSTLAVLKEHKVASKAKTRSKLLVRSIIVMLVGGEVALRVIVAKTATRSIKQLSRYN